MPITYAGGWVIVQGDYSGSDNIFEQIYNASVAGAWGIESQQKNYMQFSPTNGIQFGQTGQGSATIAVSKNENVRIVNKPFICRGNVNFSTTFTLGSYDIANDLSTDGCRVEFYNPMGILEHVQWNDLYSTLNIYDGKITVDGGGLSYVSWIQSDGNCNILDTDFFGLGASNQSANFWFQSPIAVLKRIKWTGGNFGIVLTVSDLTIEDVRVNKNTYGFGAFGNGDARNVTILNPQSAGGEGINTYDPLAVGYTFNFINCVINNSEVYYHWPADTGLSVLEKYTIDFTLKDRYGNLIENVRVRCWDNTQNPLVDTPKFDVLTNVSGAIAQQTIIVSKNQYNNVYTSYNPFIFYFNKPGWKDFWFKDNITKAIDCPFSLSSSDVQETDA